jgi:hypothetical protein
MEVNMESMTQLQKEALYRCLLNGTHDARDIYHPCAKCLLENEDEPEYAL